MARYNEILVGRYNRHFQKLLGMKGEPPAPQLSTEIQPSLSLFSGVEERVLQSWFRYGLSAVAAGVAAQVTDVRFRNPAGSNTICVFEQMMVTNGGPAADIYSVGISQTATDLGGAQTPVSLDSRNAKQSSMKISSGNNTIVGPYFMSFGIPTTSQTVSLILFDDQEIILCPGDTLQLDDTTVNQGVRFSVMWRERFLEEGERSS